MFAVFRRPASRRLASRRRVLRTTAARATLAAALMGTVALAATPPAHAAGARQTPPAPNFPDGAKVDSKARETLETMAEAYRSLNSYSGVVEVDGNGVPNMRTRRSTIAFKKPSQAAVVTTSGDEVVRAVSDGTHFFAASTQEKKEYLKVALPKNAPAISYTIDQGGAAGFGLMPLVLAGVSPLAPLAPNLQSLSTGPGGTLSGVSVDVVVAVVNGSKGDSATLTYAIGKDDHLLRRLNIRQTVDGKPVSLTETHSDIKINPDLPGSVLAFTPPPGAKAVERITPTAASAAALKVGSAAPAITGKDLSGKAVSLDQFKGKVVLVDFEATGAGPWVADLPLLIGLYDKYRKQGFEILGVSLDADQKTFRTFVKNYKIPWRQVTDGDKPALAVAQRYGVRTLPYAVLIGRDGKIAAVGESGIKMDGAIRAALAKKK